MKRAKQVVALLLAVVLFATSDSYLYQVLAAEDVVTTRSEEAQASDTTDTNTGSENDEKGSDEAVKDGTNSTPTDSGQPSDTKATEEPSSTQTDNLATPSSLQMGVQGVGVQEDVEKITLRESYSPLGTNSYDGYVDSGNTFTYSINFTLPNGFTTGNVKLKLPTDSNINLAKKEGDYVVSGDIVNRTIRPRVQEEGGELYLIVTLKEQYKGSAEIKIDFDTTNFEIVNGTSLELNPTATIFSGTKEYLGEVSASQAKKKIVIGAVDSWDIEKDVNQESADSFGSYGRLEGEYYVVDYRIDLKNIKQDFDSAGHAKVTAFQLTDTLPDKANIEKVDNVRYEETGRTENNVQDQNYTYSDGVLTFTNAIRTSENYHPTMPAGHIAPTTFYYSVYYDAEKYTSKSDVVAPTTKDITNAARLDYTLLGQEPASGEDSVTIQVGKKEATVDPVHLIVNKNIVAMNNNDVPLTKALRDLYKTGVIKFRISTPTGGAATDFEGKAFASNGVFTLADVGTINIGRLYPGRQYKLTEVLENGSTIEEAKSFLFSVDGSGNVTLAEADGDITVLSNNNVKVVNHCDGFGNAIFLKYGKEVNKEASPLANATFQLRDKTTGDSVSQATSTATGIVSFLNVPEGTYALYETNLNVAGYDKIVEGTPKYIKDVTISGNQEVKAINENDNIYTNYTNQGRLTIIKQDQDGAVISSNGTANFTIYGPFATAEDVAINPSKKLGDVTTSAAGTYSGLFTVSLTESYYGILETQAPTGYQKKEGLTTVQLVRGETTTAEIKNDKLYAYKFVKKGQFGTETFSGKILAGAKFNVYAGSDTTGAPIKENITIGNDGSSALNYLPAGSYSWKEVEAPANFKNTNLPSGTFNITKNSATVEIEATNIANYGRISITKVDQDGNPLNSAQFKVYTDDACTKPVTGFPTLITEGEGDAKGKITSPINVPLPAGTYYVKEYAAPSGYGASDEVKEVIVKVGEVAEVGTFVNRAQTSLKVIKTDESGNAITSGTATFTLKEKGKDGIIESKSTTVNGGVMSLTFTSKVEKGVTYIVTETSAPSGYRISNSPVEVKIGEGAGWDSANQIQTISVKNQKKASLKVTKTVDKTEDFTPGGVYKGAKFTLYKEDKSTIVGSQQTTNDNGIATWDNLEAGTYYLKEDSIDGYYNLYEAKDDWIEVTVGMTGEVTENVENKLKGKVEIKKVSVGSDPTVKEPLGGVTFKLLKEDPNNPGTFVEMGTSYDIKTSDEDSDKGLAISKWLEAGNYKLVEKSVPDNIVLDSTSEYPFTITDGTKNTEYIDTPIVNKRESSITIEKFGRYKGTDGTIDIPLGSIGNGEGKEITFTIYTDSTCNQVAEYKGIRFENVKVDSLGNLYAVLKGGTYYIKETATLEGYQIDTATHRVVVADGEHEFLKVYNESKDKTSIYIEKTGKKDVYDETEKAVPVKEAQFIVYTVVDKDTYMASEYPVEILGEGTPSLTEPYKCITRDGAGNLVYLIPMVGHGTSSGGGSAGLTFVTNDDGKALSIPFETNGTTTYYVREVSGGYGYEIVKEWYGPFTPAEGGAIQINPVNQAIGGGGGVNNTGYAEIVKLMKLANDLIPAEGVRYLVYPAKLGDDGEYVPDYAAGVKASGYTNEKGIYKNGVRLQAGMYAFVEAGESEYPASKNGHENVDVSSTVYPAGKNYQIIEIPTGGATKPVVGKEVTGEEGTYVGYVDGQTFVNDAKAGRFTLKKKLISGDTTPGGVFTFKLEQRKKGSSDAWVSARQIINGTAVTGQFTVTIPAGSSELVFNSGYLSTDYEYRVTEVISGSAPYYLADGEEVTRSIEIKPNTVTDVGTYTNIMYASIKVVKEGYSVAADGTSVKSKLAGVSFSLTGDTVIGTTTQLTSGTSSDTGGVTVFTKLKTGATGEANFTLTEGAIGTTNEANGFVTPIGAAAITNVVGLKAGETRVEVIKNYSEYGRFQTEKIDAQEGTIKLTGATFNIWKYANDGSDKTDIANYSNLNKTASSGTNGKITSVLLPEGYYMLEETKAPTSYKADAKYHGPYQVTKPDLKNETGSFLNITTDTKANEAVKNWKYFDVKAMKYKADKEGTKQGGLNGATFELYAADADGVITGNALQTVKSAKVGSDDGVIIFKNLTLDDTKGGIFYIKEVSSAPGYVMDAMPIKQCTTISYSMIDTRPTNTTSIKTVDSGVEFINKEGSGFVLAKKGNASAADMTGLKGAVFGFYKVDGDGVPIESSKVEMATADNGTIVFDKYENNILEDGKEYAFRELSAPGVYANSFVAANAPWYYFKANVNSTVTEYYQKNEAGKVIDSSKTDTAIMNSVDGGKLTVIKWDQKDNTRLTSAWFILLKKNGNNAWVPYNKTNFSTDKYAPTKAYMQTNGDGEFTYDYISKGEYQLLELSQLERYSTSYQAIVDEALQAIAVVEGKQDVYPQYKKNGKDITLKANTEPTSVLITDNDLGYDKVKTVHMTNKIPGKISITKYGDKDGSGTDVKTDADVKLGNVWFDLYQGETLLESKKTESNGVVEFINLAPGTYTVKENGKESANWTVDGFIYREYTEDFTISDVLIADYNQETQNKVAEVVNPSEIGLLRIAKRGSDNNDENLSGAAFEVKKIKNYDAEKKTYDIDTDFTTQAINISDSTTKEYTILVQAGARYEITETKAPTGYILNSTKYITEPIKNNQLATGNDNLTIVTNDPAPTDGAEAAITKAIRTSEGDVAELKNQKNLSDYVIGDDSAKDGLTVDFVVNGFAPFEPKGEVSKLTVTDGFMANDAGIVFYDEDGYVIPNTYADEVLKDYVMNSITFGKTANGDDSKVVKAKIFYQTTAEQKAIGTFSELAGEVTLSATDIKKVDLPAGTLGVRVEYVNVQKEFTTDGFVINTTLNYRGDWGGAILKDLQDVAKVSNKAHVSYVESYNTGLEIVEFDRTKVSNQVDVIFESRDEKLPRVNIKSIIENSEKGFVSGETMNMKVTAVNEKVENQEDLPLQKPVVSLRMPLDTSLVKSEQFNGFNVAIYNEDGTLNRAVKEGQGPNDYRLETTSQTAFVSRTTDTQTLIIDSEGRQVSQYTFVFGDEVNLEVGQTIVIEFSGEISYEAKHQGRDELILNSYLGSREILPNPSKKNPYGASFTSQKQINAEASANERVGEDTLGFISDYDFSTIYNASKLVVSKQVSTDASNFTNDNLISVKQGDSLFYKLTVFNYSDKQLSYVRLLDVLPYNNDSQYVIDSGRGTTIAAADSEHERVSFVNYTADPGATVTAYYYDEDSASDVSWNAKTSEMMNMMNYTGTTTDSAWKGQWKDSLPNSKEDVSALGLDVYFAEGLGQTESYSVVVEVKMPDFNDEQAADYFNKVVANSVYASGIEKPLLGEAITDNDKEIVTQVESNIVKAKIETPVMSVGDYVWNDSNFDGLQQDSELGINDIPVRLRRVEFVPGVGDKVQSIETESPFSTTVTRNHPVTGKAGYFEFTGLQANILKSDVTGTKDPTKDPTSYVGERTWMYYIEIDLPDGTTITTKQVGNPNLDSNGSISNSSGISYLAEKIENDSDFAKKNSALTNTYESNLFEVTLAYDKDMKKVIGVDRTDIDAGVFTAFTIGDTVWLDSNANGTLDAGEKGVQGVFVNLYKLAEGETEVREGQKAIETVVTDASGKYQFIGLEEGQYIVEYDISQQKHADYKDGTYKYDFTKPNEITNYADEVDNDSDAKYAVDEEGRIRRTGIINMTEAALGEGNFVDYRWDAGLVEYAGLGGCVFDDMDYDDLHINGKPIYPVKGVTVELYEGSTQIGATQIIDERGTYFFDGLVIPEGEEKTYRIVFTLPDKSTYEYVDQNQGNDDDIDSDAVVDFLNTKQAAINGIKLEAGKVIKNLDAGARMYSSIGDFVWLDANQDGYQNVLTEPGVEGERVVLLSSMNGGSTWNYEAEDETDADGYYEFTHLESSEDYGKTYKIIFAFDEIKRVTTPNQKSAVDPADGSEILVTSVDDSDALDVYRSINVSNLDTTLNGYHTIAFKPSYGEADMSWDAGILPEVSRVLGRTWLDTNYNGKQDPDEKAIPGVVVILEHNASGIMDETPTVRGLSANLKARGVMTMAAGETSYWKEVARMTTKADGSYLFENLLPGFYRLKFILPDGYVATQYNNVNEDNGHKLDSDASSSAGGNSYYSKTFYLESDSEVTDIDAGVYVPKNITNRIPTYRNIRRLVSSRSSRVRTGDEKAALPWLLLVIFTCGIILTITTKRKKDTKKEKKTS